MLRRWCRSAYYCYEYGVRKGVWWGGMGVYHTFFLFVKMIDSGLDA